MNVFFQQRKYLKLRDKLHQAQLKTENQTRNTFTWELQTIIKKTVAHPKLKTVTIPRKEK